MPRRTSPARSRSVKTPSKRASSSPARSRPAKYSPNAQSAEEGGSSAIVESKDGKAAQRGSLKGDWAAIGLLMLLYTLQGIPMGLSGSVPFLMQAKGISMTEQAKFSVVSWPFALKLLWAPLVDSVYVGRFGRRKTWIVPAQLCIGGLLLWAGSRIDVWLGEGGGEPDVATLTTLFLGFYFLAATQDIAVDGLALTILSPKNKELGATCNAIGQSVGFFLACTPAPSPCPARARPSLSCSDAHAPLARRRHGLPRPLLTRLLQRVPSLGRELF